MFPVYFKTWIKRHPRFESGAGFPAPALFYAPPRSRGFKRDRCYRSTPVLRFHPWQLQEQHRIQFFLKPGVLEKVGEMAACLSEGAKLLDKAHGLLVDLRNSNSLVITGDVVSTENGSGIAHVAEEGLVGDHLR